MQLVKGTRSTSCSGNLGFNWLFDAKKQKTAVTVQPRAAKDSNGTRWPTVVYVGQIQSKNVKMVNNHNLVPASSMSDLFCV